MPDIPPGRRVEVAEGGRHLFSFVQISYPSGEHGHVGYLLFCSCDNPFRGFNTRLKSPHLIV